MAKLLRSHAKGGDYNKELLEQLEGDLEAVNNEISKLLAKRTELQEDILDIKIAPFKIGDYALAEIASGRTKKWQKCLIECERATLFVRPIKEDGELSGRHFSIIPIGDQEYTDFLKEVKE